MQFRWNARKVISVPVKIYNQDQAAFQVTTRDISLGGMFIETDSAALDINTPVEVSFEPYLGGALGVNKIEALVVRVTKEGAGLMFRGSDEHEIQFLQDVMEKSERRRSARIKSGN